MYGCRLLIPTSLRTTMLSRLHDAHQGIARSQARVRLTIYWPSIDQDIEAFVQGCRHCRDCLPSNAKEPMVSKQILDRPFQQVAADFASYGGKQFLIIVDCKTIGLTSLKWARIPLRQSYLPPCETILPHSCP